MKIGNVDREAALVKDSDYPETSEKGVKYIRASG